MTKTLILTLTLISKLWQMMKTMMRMVSDETSCSYACRVGNDGFFSIHAAQDLTNPRSSCDQTLSLKWSRPEPGVVEVVEDT